VRKIVCWQQMLHGSAVFSALQYDVAVVLCMVLGAAQTHCGPCICMMAHGLRWIAFKHGSEDQMHGLAATYVLHACQLSHHALLRGV
jgi:hypothetical protein